MGRVSLLLALRSVILIFPMSQLRDSISRGSWVGAYIKILTREYAYFVELREVGDEVVYAWAFCCPPAVFALCPGKD
jgi:hypothetical protein